jgi:type IV secretion system protein TrbL
MNDTGVIDTFFATFNRYIDSGFGLLGGDVGAVANILVAIDMTLAALMWSLAAGEDVLARLMRKVLYVGFFAFLISNFHTLSTIVLESFTGLGLKAAGSGLSAEDILRPGNRCWRRRPNCRAGRVCSRTSSRFSSCWSRSCL